MTQKISGPIALVAALLVVTGCASDTPTQAADDVDDVVVAMVRVAVAHQSNGFAALIEDAAHIAAGESIASDAPSKVVYARGRDQVIEARPVTFVRHGSRTDLQSEWQMAYVTHHRSSALDIAAYSEGLVRTADSRMQGTSRGTFIIETERTAVPLSISGSYEYNGSAMFTGRTEEQYPAVRITCNWNRLLLTGTTGRCRIIGQMDVSISASGTQGTISKNARLVFDGTDHAMLTIGGRQSRVELGDGQLSSVEQ